MSNRVFTSYFLLALTLACVVLLSACGSDQDTAPSIGVVEGQVVDGAPATLQPPAAIEAALTNIGQGTSLGEFTALFSWYASLEPSDNGRTVLVQSIAMRDAKLAETLVLFSRGLDGAAASDILVSQAFTHYVIHTTEKLATMPAPGPHDLAAAYAQRLDVIFTTGLPSRDEKSLVALKEAGVLINRTRYGRDDVVPTELFDFENGAPGYRKPNAMWMAELSALAYHDKVTVEAQLRRWGYGQFVWIEAEDTDTQAFVTANDSQVVVVFRGTESARDWAIDLKSIRLPEKNSSGSVHRGFQSALDRIWEDRVEPVVSRLLGGKELYVAGHSLGAALAQLAAYRLDHGGHKVTAVYAFGSPRVGDGNFARDYDMRLSKRTFLHVNHEDIVTRTPPKWLGFSDLGRETAWEFAEPKGHKLTPLKDGPWNEVEEAPFFDGPDVTDEMRQSALIRQQDELEDVLEKTTQYLRTPDPAHLEAVSYGTSFQSGAIDNHGIYEYLFKIGCAIIEDQFTAMDVIPPDAPSG